MAWGGVLLWLGEGCCCGLSRGVVDVFVNVCGMCVARTVGRPQATVDDVMQLRRLENEPTRALYFPQEHDVKELFSSILEGCLGNVCRQVNFSYMFPSSSSGVYADGRVLLALTNSAIM